MTVATVGAHGHENLAGTKRAGIRAKASEGGTRLGGPAASGPSGEVG
jgi:hypothetical protein